MDRTLESDVRPLAARSVLALDGRVDRSPVEEGQAPKEIGLT
jgi:hypothetical protein